ncbi:unnamed protein product [Meganyctiphanes norvegica]|uniref:Uncharacterized protein n=1 Tax=Meganyctiphanes norvegica TaxID=48144 RepID=A0AAV2R5T3_MEGNR
MHFLKVSIGIKLFSWIRFFFTILEKIENHRIHDFHVARGHIIYQYFSLPNFLYFLYSNKMAIFKKFLDHILFSNKNIKYIFIYFLYIDKVYFQQKEQLSTFTSLKSIKKLKYIEK